jgi:RNA polymerase sigma-70 factor (ECF subfamily)
LASGRPEDVDSSAHDRDDELVRRAKNGDVAAYGQLVQRHQALAVKTAMILGAGHSAEDVAQEAFLAAWRSLDRFHAGRPFRPWILRIVTNEVRSRQRTNQRREAILARHSHDVAPDDTAGGEVVAVQADTSRIVLAAIARLPERHRAVVAYRYLLQLSESETAAALRCPPGSVKSRLSRAMARLRDDPSLVELLDRT